MKTIFFFIVSMEPGGVENYLLRFLRYKKGSAKVFVFCKSGAAGELFDEYKNLGIKVILLKTGYFNLSALIKVYRYYQMHKPSSVCDLTSNFGGLILSVARIAGVKKRIAFYRQSSNHFKETKFRLLYNWFVNRLVYYNSTAVLSNSKAALSFFFKEKEAQNTKFNVVYNGIDPKDYDTEVDKRELRKELRLPVDAFIVGHSGRVNSAKNHEAIIKTAKEINKIDSTILFVLCGRGTEELAESADVNNIIGLGHRSDIPKILHALDLFYFPSITEGQPNSLIEAMISGLPVVTSNIPPILETLPTEFHRFAVDPYDIEASKKLILDIKNNPRLQNVSLLKEQARRKYDSIEQFDRFDTFL